MNHNIEQDLYLECKRFRHAIEENKLNLGLDYFSKFPARSCGDTALMLGDYLKQKGFGTALNVSGFIGQQSHAWLELNDLYIDITADQFPQIDDDVIVTSKSLFHEQFKNISKWNCDELIIRENQLKAYRMILGYLSKEQLSC